MDLGAWSLHTSHSLEGHEAMPCKAGKLSLGTVLMFTALLSLTSSLAVPEAQDPSPGSQDDRISYAMHAGRLTTACLGVAMEGVGVLCLP